MQYLKVVRYLQPEGIHQGFDIYEANSIHATADAVRLEGPMGVISIATDPGLHFYIMNANGDTVDHFAWDWLRGSPERSRRVIEAAERLSASADSVQIIAAENREIYVGRHVRESGSIATSLNMAEGPGPALMDDRTTAQLASALLRGPFAPDA